MRFFSLFKNSLHQYFKYCIVGLSCAAIDLGVLNGLLYFFLTERTSLLALYNSAAYGFAVLNSYIWNSKYTFKVKKTPGQFIAFMIQALVSLIIANLVFIFGLWSLGFVYVLPKWLKTNMAKAVSMFLSSTASFFFNKFIVFQKKSLENPVE